MAKIVSNRLLLVSLCILAFYWITASLTPNPYLSIANNILLFVASGFGLWRYREKTIDIVFRGDRVISEDGGGYGGYLAVYGIFLVFMGSFYSALYSSVWIFMEQPQSWIGTSYAQFGRFLTICGFACMAFSPDLTREGFVLPGKLWALLLILAALFVSGFYLGSSVDARGTKPSGCPEGWVLGTSKKTYHTPQSPYRELVRPRVCFATEQDAIESGYSSPAALTP